MRTMTEPEEDIPKLVAAVLTAAPAIVVRTGYAYLSAKRKIRKGARLIEKGMVENGLPKELAHRLASEYEADLSLRRLMRDLAFEGWRDRPGRTT